MKVVLMPMQRSIPVADYKSILMLIPMIRICLMVVVTMEVVPVPVPMWFDLLPPDHSSMVLMPMTILMMVPTMIYLIKIPFIGAVAHIQVRSNRLIIPMLLLLLLFQFRNIVFDRTIRLVVVLLMGVVRRPMRIPMRIPMRKPTYL